jgi:hypothetical protein
VSVYEVDSVFQVVVDRFGLGSLLQPYHSNQRKVLKTALMLTPPGARQKAAGERGQLGQRRENSAPTALPNVGWTFLPKGDAGETALAPKLKVISEKTSSETVWKIRMCFTPRSHKALERGEKPPYCHFCATKIRNVDPSS